MASACSHADEQYDELVIVASHSQLMVPFKQVPIPVNMTVTTPCMLNESVGVNTKYAMDVLKPLFKKNESKMYGMMMRPTWVHPCESEIKHQLKLMRASEIIASSSSHGISARKGFRQRKQQATMTMQRCFMPGNDLAHISGIFAFSKGTPDGEEITRAIVEANPESVQLYRPTNAKDLLIIEIENMAMAQNIACPNDREIISNGRGEVTQDDINNLHHNREMYRHAIDLIPPPQILCGHDINDVEQLRIDILGVIQKNAEFVAEYYKSASLNHYVISKIRTTLKKQSKSFSRLVDYLIFNVMSKIHHTKNMGDHKIVRSKYAETTSDVILERIRARRNGNVYVLFIGCRCEPVVPSDAECVTHSPRSASESKIDFGGKRHRTPKRIKKTMVNRSHRYRHRHRK